MEIERIASAQRAEHSLGSGLSIEYLRALSGNADSIISAEEIQPCGTYRGTARASKCDFGQLSRERTVTAIHVVRSIPRPERRPMMLLRAVYFLASMPMVMD